MYKQIIFILKKIKYLITNTTNCWVLPGHFYSPISSTKEIKNNEEKVFNYDQKSFPAINLNEKKQIELLECFTKYKSELVWKNKSQEDNRYYYENNMFAKADADILFYFMRSIKPKKIVEVGSGFSSAVMLDTNDKFFNGKLNLTFIEPYAERLKKILKKEDLNNIKIYEKKLQEISLKEFSELEKNDFLFIDSSHVSKIGSDVNYIFFEILPHLKSGVYIHFHDIIHPFEYFKEWVYEGRSWNEVYLLRSFLQYNNDFEIMFFNSYMSYHYNDLLKEKLDIQGGGSFWIRKR